MRGGHVRKVTLTLRQRFVRCVRFVEREREEARKERGRDQRRGVLGAAQEEQRSGQAIARRPARQGGRDRHPRRFPRTGEPQAALRTG